MKLLRAGTYAPRRGRSRCGRAGASGYIVGRFRDKCPEVQVQGRAMGPWLNAAGPLVGKQGGTLGAPSSRLPLAAGAGAHTH